MSYQHLQLHTAAVTRRLGAADRPVEVLRHLHHHRRYICYLSIYARNTYSECYIYVIYVYSSCIVIAIEAVTVQQS